MPLYKIVSYHKEDAYSHKNYCLNDYVYSDSLKPSTIKGYYQGYGVIYTLEDGEVVKQRNEHFFFAIELEEIPFKLTGE